MTSFRFLAIAGALGLSMLPAFAQPANAPAPQVDKPMDCAKTPMKRHDHGLERGTGPTAAAMPCAAEAAPSQPSARVKKIIRHDHAKFHKNQ